MSEEELYLSLESKAYKDNKSNILNSQADLLRMLKTTYHLKVLRSQKRDLHLKLRTLFSKVVESVESLEQEFPHPNLKEKIKTIKSSKNEELEPIKKDTKKAKKDTGHLDDELTKIQEKLRELNS